MKIIFRTSPQTWVVANTPQNDMLLGINMFTQTCSQLDTSIDRRVCIRNDCCANISQGELPLSNLSPQLQHSVHVASPCICARHWIFATFLLKDFLEPHLLDLHNSIILCHAHNDKFHFRGQRKNGDTCLRTNL